MSTMTLFAAQAADAASAAIRIKPITGNVLLETVLVQGTGTWSGATVTLQVSLNGNASPATWGGMTDTSGTAIAVFTDTFAVNLELPTGCWFRAVVSGSGSPVPSLTVKAAGDIEAA
jgi:hypothetical protein